MIIPAAPTDDQYSSGDLYAADSQYGDTGPATDPYGSDYGTGAYSDYNSETGRYTTTIQIAGYGSQSDDGYGYTIDETGTGYGDLSTDSYRYEDGQDAIAGAGAVAGAVPSHGGCIMILRRWSGTGNQCTQRFVHLDCYPDRVGATRACRTGGVVGRHLVMPPCRLRFSASYSENTSGDGDSNR